MSSSTCTRYEYLLLKERNLKEKQSQFNKELQSVKTNENHNTIETNHDEIQFQLHMIKASCRASMIGMIESQLYLSSKSSSSSSKTKRKHTKNKMAEETHALAALLYHTQSKYNETCYEGENPSLLNKAFEKLSIFRSMKDNEQTNLSDEKKTFQSNEYDWEDPDIDGFFQNYPECENNDPSYISDDDEYYDYHEYQKFNSQQPLNPSTNSNTSNLKSKSFHTTASKNSVAAPDSTNQKYNTKKLHPKQFSNSTNSTSTSTSWESYNSLTNPTIPKTLLNQYNSNNIHHFHPQKKDHINTQHKQPSNNKSHFVTARELAQNHNDVDMEDHSTDNHSNHTNTSNTQLYSSHCANNHHAPASMGYPNNNIVPNSDHGYGLVSYQNQQQPQQQQNSTSTQVLRGPKLSAGLKRKYKPPKLKPNKSSNNTNNTQNNGDNSGGIQKANKRKNSFTSNQNTNTSRNRSTSNNNNDNNNKINHKDTTCGEECDELPEELQHLEKELVLKIENEILDNGESVTFADIAGLENAKQTVMELVCWPMKRPDLFTGLRKGPNGLLLFGPPGTGKTLIGKAVAHESGATFFSISSSSLTSKWIGEGEKLVKTLFAVAKYRQPAVVFIDEIDSLLTQRKADENEASRRIKTEFLVQLDGTGSSTNTGADPGMVLVIGATNRPYELDDAARRRFVKRIYIPLPERSDREVLLRTLLQKNTHCMTEKDISKLAADTDGFSGADLKALCTDAALGPIRQLGARALLIKAEDVPPISYRHFRSALKGMNPSVAQSDLDIYLDWNNTYGSTSMVGTKGQYDDDSTVDSREDE